MSQEPELCSNCENMVLFEDLPLTDEIRRLGFARLTRCPRCGDEVLHPPVGDGQ